MAEPKAEVDIHDGFAKINEVKRLIKIFNGFLIVKFRLLVSLLMCIFLDQLN